MHTDDIGIDPDFQAEMDMRTVLKAEEVKQNAGRMRAAKEFASRESERFQQIADKFPQTENKAFIGSVKNSRMKPNA